MTKTKEVGMWRSPVGSKFQSQSMKKAMSSTPFLLAATILGIGFVILLGQQAALPAYSEYVNGKRTPSGAEPFVIPKKIRLPEEVYMSQESPIAMQASSSSHPNLSQKPVAPIVSNSEDSSRSGNITVEHKPTDKAMTRGARISNGEGIICDRSHSRTDTCSVFGRVQMDPKSSLFLLNAVDESNSGLEEKVRPYTRKWEKDVMDWVHEVTLRSTVPQNGSMLICDVQHEVPAVVFSTGGYTGNLYHEFNDGIIPLYITSQHMKREVVFIIVDYRDWWLTKYDEVLNQLTKYRVINLENETLIHCFPEVKVGLFIHAELTIFPSLMPNNETILDFRALLDRAYTPGYPLPTKSLITSKRPKLVILIRDGNRVILNIKEVVRLAKHLGFNVALWKPLPTTDLKATYRLLNSSHVLIGVHGAALTHFLFMRPGSVFIQIIPLGTDWASHAYYGDPAERMGLQYIGYKIGLKESTLSNRYEKNDTVLMDPMAIIKQGWLATKEVYLESQDVCLDLSRVKNTLIDAKRRAIGFIRLGHRKGHNG